MLQLGKSCHEAEPIKLIPSYQETANAKILTNGKVGKQSARKRREQKGQRCVRLRATPVSLAKAERITERQRD